MELDDLNVVKEYREDNNEATKGFLIGAAIELIVLDTNLVVENVRPVVGETISISAVIFNAGIISTNNVLVYFYLDTTIPGALMDSTTISIAAGGSETAVGDIPTYALASGYHTIFVVVDPKNVFPEKNENNNQADAQFIIDTGAPVIRCDSIVTDTITPGAFSPNGDGINDSALIVYTVSDSIPGDIFVRIRILDRFGSVIRTIANPVLRPQGQNTVDTWDGLDRFGTAAPDDIYTVELRATDQTGNVSAVDTRCTVVVDAQPLRIDIPTAVPGNINPRDFVLSGPETTTISFEISEPANVSVFIVDSVSGDTVDTPILDQPAPRGLFAVRYTGTNMVLGNSHRVVVQARTPFEFTETETVLFDNVDVQMRVFNISDVPDPFDPSLGEQTTIQFDIEGGPLQAFADWSIQYYDAYAVETSPPHFGFFVALPSTVTDSWDGLDFSSGQLRHSYRRRFHYNRQSQGRRRPDYRCRLLHGAFRRR
jgi:hypothetical protein